MPKDNIERAIKRGTGEIEGADYEEMTYEGYAPGGIAVFVESLTDNTNRTVADVRSLFSKARRQPRHVGLRRVPVRAEGDLRDRRRRAGRGRPVPARGRGRAPKTSSARTTRSSSTTPVEAFGAVQGALEEAGIEPKEAALVRIPTTDDGARPGRRRQSPPPPRRARRAPGRAGRLHHPRNGRRDARRSRAMWPSTLRLLHRPSSPMIVLGIDPGTRHTGYGVLEVAGRRERSLDYGTIDPPAKLDLMVRLQHIGEAVDALIDRLRARTSSPSRCRSWARTRSRCSSSGRCRRS